MYFAIAFYHSTVSIVFARRIFLYLHTISPSNYSFVGNQMNTLTRNIGTLIANFGLIEISKSQDTCTYNLMCFQFALQM